MVAELGALVPRSSKSESLLAEAFPSRPRETVVLVAVREGIADELQEVDKAESTLMVYQRMVRRLFDRSGITPGDATWSVHTWAEAWAERLRSDSSRSDSSSPHATGHRS